MGPGTTASLAGKESDGRRLWGHYHSDWTGSKLVVGSTRHDCREKEKSLAPPRSRKTDEPHSQRAERTTTDWTKRKTSKEGDGIRGDECRHVVRKKAPEGEV